MFTIRYFPRVLPSDESVVVAAGAHTVVDCFILTTITAAAAAATSRFTFAVCC